MSTLAEIEAAAEALPVEEKQELIRFLTSRLNGEKPTEQQTDLAAFSGTVKLPQDPLAWQQRVRGEWE
ncbi:MAG TPA: hypothetical protein VE031_01165 [Chthoniobacterales bacterium]|nr:hypothetical protein [Chthoniobacterales bacterium]